jgi:hypothetical protein
MLSERSTIAYKQKAEKGTGVALNLQAFSFLTSVGWSREDFLSTNSACFSIMGERWITEKEHLFSHLAYCILVMSGLSWNPDSKNWIYDWMCPTSAVTGETALVQLYRKKLLTKCASACMLQKDLYDVFLSLTINCG